MRGRSLLRKINNALLREMNNHNNLRPAVFLHIQKTAGTSIVDYAKRYYRKVISHGEAAKYQVRELEDVEFISGHFGYEFTKIFTRKIFFCFFERSC